MAPMDEELNHLYEDNFNLNSSLIKFKEMLKGSQPRFFDVQEFEDIIEYYTDQQNFKYADQAVKFATRIHPHASTLKLKEARLYIEKGDNKLALKILENIEAIEYHNADLYFLKGIACFALNEFGEAHSNLELAVEITEGPEEKEDLLYQIALNILQLEDYDSAIPYLLRAYELNHQNLLVIYELANCYEVTGKYDDSAQYYLHYLDIDPFSESIWNALGIIYLEDNLFDKAIEAFDYAIAINPMYTSPFINKANLHLKKGDNFTAIKIYEELINLDVNNPQTYYLIGECYEKTNHIVMALEYYNKAKSIDETYADAWFGIGNIYAQLNQHNLCIHYFEKAIFYDEENPDYWYNLGIAYTKTDHNDDALEAFGKVLSIDNQDAEAWIEQAKILEQREKLNDAILILNEAYLYNFDNALINYHLSKLHFKNDQINLSLKYFQKALKLDFSSHNDLIKECPAIMEHTQFVDLLKKQA